MGRGITRSAIAASDLMRQCKVELAGLIGASSESDVAMVSNGTQALNAALLGLLKPGDHVVTTAAEHNSVLRPLAMLVRRKLISCTIVPVDAVGRVSVDEIRSVLQSNTRMIAITHASNVTGAIQPIDAIAHLAKEKSIALLLDAAQTIGYLPINVRSQGIDLLAAPGHKGLGGMLGTGFLYMNERAQEVFEAPWIGGTGSSSDWLDGPFDWAASIESGNPNGPAIASLLAGLRWLQEESQGLSRQRLLALSERMLQILGREEFQLIGPTAVEDRIPVFSVVSSIMGPQEWTMLLDSEYQIETRAGLHCAGAIHDYLGTKAGGGTLRLSLGHTSQASDLDRLEHAIDSIL